MKLNLETKIFSCTLSFIVQIVANVSIQCIILVWGIDKEI